MTAERSTPPRICTAISRRATMATTGNSIGRQWKMTSPMTCGPCGGTYTDDHVCPEDESGVEKSMISHMRVLRREQMSDVGWVSLDAVFDELVEADRLRATLKEKDEENERLKQLFREEAEAGIAAVANLADAGKRLKIAVEALEATLDPLETEPFSKAEKALAKCREE